jgi:hypothetical protein
MPLEVFVRLEILLAVATAELGWVARGLDVHSKRLVAFKHLAAVTAGAVFSLPLVINQGQLPNIFGGAVWTFPGVGVETVFCQIASAREDSTAIITHMMLFGYLVLVKGYLTTEILVTSTANKHGGFDDAALSPLDVMVMMGKLCCSCWHEIKWKEV